MQNHIGIQAGMSLSRLGRLCRGLSSYMYGSLCVSFGHITLEINTSLVVRSAERSDASAARGAAVVCGSASGRWARPRPPLHAAPNKAAPSHFIWCPSALSSGVSGDLWHVGCWLLLLDATDAAWVANRMGFQKRKATAEVCVLVRCAHVDAALPLVSCSKLRY